MNIQDRLQAVAQRTELQAQREAVARQMNDMTETDDWTPAKEKEFAKLRVELLGDAENGVVGLDNKLAVLQAKLGNAGPAPRPVISGGERSTFSRWLAGGALALGVDEQAEFIGDAPPGANMPGSAGDNLDMKGFRIAPNNIFNALTSPAAADRPEGVADVTTANMVIHRLKAFGGVRQMCYQFDTARGEDLIIPNLDNVAEEGALLAAEDTNSGDDDTPAFGDTRFRAYVFSSNTAAVSNPLLTDAVVDVEGIVTNLLVRRVGRICNKLMTTGTGTGQPQGLVTGAAAGVTAAAQTSLAWSELVALIHSVDPAYREGMESPDQRDGGLMSESGQIGFMFNDRILQAIAQLQDGESRPIFLPSVREGTPNRILGYPYAVNQHMANPAAGADTALFGNFGYYGCRNVTDMMFFRFTDSTYSKRNTTGFLMFVRSDGRYRGAVVGGKCEAVAKLTMAA